MANEMMTLNQGKQILRDHQLDVEYELPAYELHNYDTVAEAIEAINERAQTLVFNIDDKKDALEVRSELIAIEKQIEDKRKEVKRELEKPSKQFDSQMRALTNKIKPALENVRQTVTVIEQAERDLREKVLQEYIGSQLEKSKVNYIEQQPNWTNAGAFTNKMKLTKKVQDEITDAIVRMEQEAERLDKEVAIIEDTAKANNLLADAYLDMYKMDTPLTDVLSSINRAVTKRVEQQAREAEEAKEREEEARQQAEIEAQQLAEPNIKVVEKEPINQEVSFLDLLNKEDLKTEPARSKYQINIVATPEQHDQLIHYMSQNGILWTEELITIDDLPW